MFIPFMSSTGWQAVFRRVVEWRRKMLACHELMTLGEHDPDLPISKTEAQLEVHKCCWQA